MDHYSEMTYGVAAAHLHIMRANVAGAIGRGNAKYSSCMKILMAFDKAIEACVKMEEKESK